MGALPNEEFSKQIDENRSEIERTVEEKGQISVSEVSMILSNNLFVPSNFNEHFIPPPNNDLIKNLLETQIRQSHDLFQYYIPENLQYIKDKDIFKYPLEKIE